MVWIGPRLNFFQWRWVIVGRLLAHAHTPVHGQDHDAHQPIQSIRGSQLHVFQLKTATFEVRKQRLNGLITNDKFYLIHTGRLALSWWRRPLRLRNPATATYLHEVSVPRGGAYEAVMACASIPTGEPGWSAAVGSSLPAPAALGDADRAGGDP